MIFRRLYHDRLAQASYLIACEATRRAIVVDPLRDPRRTSRPPRRGRAHRRSSRRRTSTPTSSPVPRRWPARPAPSCCCPPRGARVARLARRAAPAHAAPATATRSSLGRVRLDVCTRRAHARAPRRSSSPTTRRASSPVGILSGDFLFVGDVGSAGSARARRRHRRARCDESARAALPVAADARADCRTTCRSGRATARARRAASRSARFRRAPSATSVRTNWAFADR